MTIFDDIYGKSFPFAIGFDRTLRLLEQASTVPSNISYPPYNIVKEDDEHYRVELAVAGFGKKDIEVQYEDNRLTVKSRKTDKSEEKDEDGNIIHRGSSKRIFSKSFTIADDVEIKGAELKDGLLKVSMERIVPEAKNARTIEIK